MAPLNPQRQPRTQTHFYRKPSRFRRWVGRVLLVLLIIVLLIGLGFMANLLLGAA